MTRTARIPNWGPILALAVCAALPAYAGLAGDVNLDGTTNVLDVQAGVTQALGAAPATLEADVDLADGVNILDIQHLINTALGTGGLIQRVRGVVDCACEAERIGIVAISREGHRVRAEVDRNTGEFTLPLRVRTTWALALCVRAQQQYRCLATTEFPVGDRLSCTLPLPRLSRGEPLNLGRLLLMQRRLRVQTDLRRLLGELDEPADLSDDNGNGMPDFIEPLVRRAGQGPGVSPEADIEALIALAADCVAAVFEADPYLDLSDEDGNAVPDFVEPVLECLCDALEVWLPQQPPVSDIAGNRPERSINEILRHVAQGVPGWLRSLERAGLIDDDGNGVPDHIEPDLSTAEIATGIDRNADLTPDFAEDHDDDGVPNISDEDFASVDDHDGDGIDDSEDVDDDNDGTPDYADGNPLDPTVLAVAPTPLGR